MNEDRKAKLMGLGAETLADALLKLTTHSEEAEAMVERLIASPRENLRRFKHKLAELKESHRDIERRNSSHLARDLEGMLEDLKSGAHDPVTGIESLVEFFEADSVIMEMCDDSYGHVSDVFQIDAKEMFIEYALRFPDKEKLAGIIMDLIRNDDYGMRGSLLDCAGKCLPASVIRSMIVSIENRVKLEASENTDRSHLSWIASLARQIRDAELFVRATLATSSNESHGRSLAASLIYRRLLDSILMHAVCKAYTHGVRYLRKLDLLAGSISDWQGMDSHETYHASIIQAHRRKRPFGWSMGGRYERTDVFVEHSID